MRWAATALAAAALAALSGGCAGPPRVPEGIELVEPEAPPPPPEVFEEAQRRLQRRGWYAGPIDGTLGPATRVAIAKLQRERELEVTGRLDPATLDALGIAPGAFPERVRDREAPEEEPGPTPAPPLVRPTEPPRPQPPPGALDEARAEARRLLAAGAARAEVPPPGVLADGPLAPPAEAMDEAGEALSGGRRAAFARLLEARVEGGWALLPGPLIAALELALAERSLLVHGPDGRIGEDDVVAIEWVERSAGLPPSGRPSLRLLEALGIDPTPMFAP